MAAAITLNNYTTMETIELKGKQYKLDWTFTSEAYIEQAAEVLKSVGNIGKAAILAVGALRGGDWTFDKGPDWVLAQIGKDAKKMNELSDKVLKVVNEFNEFNRYEASLEGNAEAPSEGAKN